MAWAHLWLVHPCPVVLVHRSGTYAGCVEWMECSHVSTGTPVYLWLVVVGTVEQGFCGLGSLSFSDKGVPCQGPRAFRRIAEGSQKALRGIWPARFSHWLSLSGHCATLPLSQKYVSREGWLYHVWVHEAAAYVPHGDAGNDQPHPVYR